MLVVLTLQSIRAAKLSQEMSHLKMIILSLALAFAVEAFCLDQSSDQKLIQRMRVMVSESKPFAFYENHSCKGLEVEILENFAKRQNLKVEYIVIGAPLREVFSSEEQFNNFSKSPEFS